MTIYLLRHGLTDWLLPPRNRLAGRLTGIGLNARGRAQAAALAQAMATVALTRVVSSPIDRAVETARAVAAARGAPMNTDERLTEWAMGGWEGRLVEEVIAEQPAAWETWRRDPAGLVLDGAETAAAMADRMEAAFWDLAEQGGSVALVSHQDPLLALLCRVIRAPLSTMRRLEIGVASITQVALRGRTPVLLATNHTAHLRRAPPQT